MSFGNKLIQFNFVIIEKFDNFVNNEFCIYSKLITIN